MYDCLKIWINTCRRCARVLNCNNATSTPEPPHCAPLRCRILARRLGCGNKIRCSYIKMSQATLDARASAAVSRIMAVVEDSAASEARSSAQPVTSAASTTLSVHGHFGLGYVELGGAAEVDGGRSNGHSSAEGVSSLVGKRLAGDTRRKRRRLEGQGRDMDEEIDALHDSAFASSGSVPKKKSGGSVVRMPKGSSFADLQPGQQGMT